MIKLKFDLEEAQAFAQVDCIEEWVHIFLKTVGENRGLSDGLKLQKRYWLGPTFLPLDELNRCCGPEPEMEYYNNPEDWEKHINRFTALLLDGWEYPPLIAEHKEGILTVRDGNHRLESILLLL